MFRTQDAENTINGGLVGVYYTITNGNVNPSETAPGSDNIRSQHAALSLLEYVTGRNDTGDWQNYTRSFSPAFYVAYLRYSSFGATSNELHLVTSDPTQTNQTTVKLGTFSIPNNIRWVNYLYTPLMNDAGNQPLLSLTGTNTLRLLSTGTPGEDLLLPIFRRGKRVYQAPSLADSRRRTQQQLALFHAGIKRIINPHEYPAGLELGLHQRKTELILKARGYERS